MAQIIEKRECRMENEELFKRLRLNARGTAYRTKGEKHCAKSIVHRVKGEERKA